VICKNILGLDASLGSLSLCLLTTSGTTFYRTEATLPLSQVILPCIEKIMQQAELQWCDLDAFALGCGPGSFTGLRVVAATVSGMNSRLKLPVLSLCSLYIRYLQANTQQEAWVIEDARSQSVYAACFKHTTIIKKPECIPLAQLESYEAARFITLQVPKAYFEAWDALPLLLDRAQALGQALQYANWNDSAQWSRYPELNYLQVSQAERMML